MKNKNYIIIGSILLLIVIIYFLSSVQKDYSEEIKPNEIRLADRQFMLEGSENEILSEIEQEKRISGLQYFHEYEYLEGNPDDRAYVSRLVEEFEDPKDDTIRDVSFGNDLYLQCASYSHRDIRYCRGIKNIYKKIICAETYFMFKAIENKKSELCIELGSNKIYPWCTALIKSDSEICNNPNIENIEFVDTCKALAKKDIKLCENSKITCELVFYTLTGLKNKNPDACKNIEKEGDSAICSSILKKDDSYCNSAYISSP